MKAKKVTKKRVTKKTAASLPKSLDHPTLTLVVEFDTDEDLRSLMDSITDLMDMAKGDGDVVKAELTNVPATLDCMNLDRY